MVLGSGRLCIQTTWSPLKFHFQIPCLPGPTANFPCADFRDLRMFNMLSFDKFSQFPVFLPDREFFCHFPCYPCFPYAVGTLMRSVFFFPFFFFLFQTTPHHLALTCNEYAPDGEWGIVLMNWPATLGFRDNSWLVERWASL